MFDLRLDFHRGGVKVLMDMHSWELLSDWIETVTDAKIAQYSLRELENAGGRPEQAGWLDWETIRDAWNDDDGDLEMLLAEL